MAHIEEIPLDTIDTPLDVPLDAPIVEDIVATHVEVEDTTQDATQDATQAKPKARGKRGPDKRTRAKPKPKAKTKHREPILQIETIPQYESESSADEASIQELHTMQLIRSIRAYDQTRKNQKHEKYASWFGR